MEKHRVKNLLYDNFPMLYSINNISEILGISENTIRLYVKELYEYKIFNRVKIGKGFLYLYAKNERWV